MFTTDKRDLHCVVYYAVYVSVECLSVYQQHSIATITQFEHCEYVYMHELVGCMGQGA